MILMLSATFASVMSTVGYILLAVLCLMFMVVVHEFGHYIAGKLLGFKINEFAIGFGPPFVKITSKKSGEVFSIRPIPLGGFCQFEGEDEETDTEGAFNKKEPWKRLIVLFSGALFNFLSALIVITLVFTFYGQILPVIGTIAEESAIATKGELQEGDIVLKVNGKTVNILMQDDLNRAFARIEDEGTFTVLRNGKKIKVAVQKSDIYVLDEDGNRTYDQEGNAVTRYAFGFQVGMQYIRLNFFDALARSFSYGFFVVYKILWLLGQLITGGLALSESAGGPVTIISTISEASQSGFGPLAYVICLISANLAVMNLLPIPALDGSRMVFTTIEWIAGKPINRKVEGIIHFTGLILMFLFAIFADVLHFLS